MFKTTLAALTSSIVAAKKAPLIDDEMPQFPQYAQLLSLAAQDYMNGGLEQPIELAKSTTVPCNYYLNDAWYNLAETDVQLYTTNEGTGQINSYAAFSFCNKISAATDQIATAPLSSSEADKVYCANPDYYDNYALYAIPSSLDGDKLCTPLSTSDLDSITSASFTNSQTNSEELSLVYKADSGCSLTVNMICDENLTTPVIGSLVDLPGECNYQTTFTGDLACPSLDLSTIWDFFEQNSWLWGILLIAGGLFVCFFGRWMFKATVFLATTLVVIFGILILFYSTFLKDTTQDWVAWTVLACSVLIGLVAGFFMMKLERVGAAILAGWGGFMVGALINEMALYKVGSNALFWSVCIGCAILAAILTFFIYNHVLIIMTSFAGAYSFWRGISLYAGGFPNEFTLAQEIQEGVVTSINGWFYAYMVAILITCGVGAFVQYRKLNQMTEEEKHPYAKLK